jgi:hypothetical protein
MEAAYRTWNELRVEGDAAAADYRQLKWVTERQIEELKSREDFAQRVAAEAKERADQAYAAYLAAASAAEAEEADFSADLAARVSEAKAAAAAEAEPLDRLRQQSPPLGAPEARQRPPVADAEAKEADFWNTGAGSMTTLQMAEQNQAQAARGVKRALKADVEAWCARVPLMDRAYRAAKEGRCWDCYVKTDHRDGPATDPMALPMCKDCYVSWTTER